MANLKQCTHHLGLHVSGVQTTIQLSARPHPHLDLGTFHSHSGCRQSSFLCVPRTKPLSLLAGGSHIMGADFFTATSLTLSPFSTASLIRSGVLRRSSILINSKRTGYYPDPRSPAHPTHRLCPHVREGLLQPCSEGSDGALQCCLPRYHTAFRKEPDFHQQCVQALHLSCVILWPLVFVANTF